MEQFCKGDLVRVRGLTNHTQYNGREAVISATKTLKPDKCVITLLDDCQKEGKQLLIKGQCLELVEPVRELQKRHAQRLHAVEEKSSDRNLSTPLDDGDVVEIRCFPMEWGGAQQRLYEMKWKQRVASMDPIWFQLSSNDVYKYLILKLAELIRRKKSIGQAAWTFAGKQVKDLRYGCVWSHGGREQETPLPENVCDPVSGCDVWGRC